MSQTTPDDVEVSPRHDTKPKNAAPKTRKKREAKVRFDSEPDAAIDGYGDPFHVETKPGWEAYWVSDFDRSRIGVRRKWEMARWGDHKIVSYFGAEPGKAGEPIRHRELTLYLMSSEQAAAARARDPRLRGRAELRKVIWSGARRVEQTVREVSFER